MDEKLWEMNECIVKLTTIQEQSLKMLTELDKRVRDIESKPKTYLTTIITAIITAIIAAVVTILIKGGV